MKPTHQTAEHRRLADSAKRKADWKLWGPYVSDRAWGTVREDYSEDGEAWNYFLFDHSHLRAYRWNEDGLAGFCNRFQNICMAPVFWNGKDPILKERLFGLSGKEGNHGEDCKEHYYHLDALPSHAYMKMLYKYPQVEFPYKWLRQENAGRDRDAPEFELVDAIGAALEQGRYFDIVIEYAKADEETILCKIEAWNRGPEPAVLHILPHLWYRNTWSWKRGARRSEIWASSSHLAETYQKHIGRRWWYAEDQPDAFRGLLFTENETNRQTLWGTPNPHPQVKDGILQAVIYDRVDLVSFEKGSKAAAHYAKVIPPGSSWSVRTVFSEVPVQDPFEGFEKVIEVRQRESDEYHRSIQGESMSEDDRRIQRQAFAGLMWSKQFYHYNVELWLEGDPIEPPPPAKRFHGRNSSWTHLSNLDIISMPDKWEYPWYAVWDLAFHCVPIARIDPEWAKRQLVLMLREWYMHPNGQIAAYEWNFGDVNPPVHAWSALRVYQMDSELSGKADTNFLEEVFHKLLLNFTWWVNRKDAEGRNVFQGGFLGLDNIGVFDRSAPLPDGGHLEQADGTAWMGMYCLNMLAIALELARVKPSYESVATKFFEHFIYIAAAINANSDYRGLWDEEDGFYYDALHFPDGRRQRLKLRTFVGLAPLFAVETFDQSTLNRLPQFRRRVEWFLKYRPHLVKNIASITQPGANGLRLLSLVDRQRLTRILSRMLDSDQFLSDYGLRSLSKEHGARPYVYHDGKNHLSVTYEPGESSSPLFGGNSNWRGPIWFPVNYLMIEAMRKYHEYYADDFQIALPAGSDRLANLGEVADDLARRLVSIFQRDPQGRRPVNGQVPLFQNDPHWKDQILFYEYFHGEDGRGLGASHQTGWTALAAELIHHLNHRKPGG